MKLSLKKNDKNTEAYCTTYGKEFREHYVDEYELNEVADVGGSY
jgi:hypothetical protein